MTNYLLYFTHGSDEFLNEAYYALLSYYAHHREDENKVVVYTDNIDFFKDKLPQSVDYVAFDKTIVQKWKGDINFVHRVKIELLIDFAKRYQGNVLYLDSDTYFKTNISHLFEKIQNGQYIMSLDEGPISNQNNIIFKRFTSYFKSVNYSINTPMGNFPIDRDVRMYNAGIIGINTQKNQQLFEQALQITDTIYPKHASHVAEQFAFCYLMQNKTEQIIEAEPLIHHYWYFKEFRSIIADFLQKNAAKSFSELVALSKNCNPERMGSEKLAYIQMNFFEKLWQKATKFRKWKVVTN